MTKLFAEQTVKCTCGWAGKRKELLVNSRYEGYDVLGEPVNWIEDYEVCPSCISENVDVA